MRANSSANSLCDISPDALECGMAVWREIDAVVVTKLLKMAVWAEIDRVTETKFTEISDFAQIVSVTATNSLHCNG